MNTSYFVDKLELSRNKAFRLLLTLESKGLIERDDVSGCYQLGLNAMELSQKILNSASIISYAHPVMERLAIKHKEAVYMTVLKGEEVIFLDMVDCEQNVKAAPLIGKRFPLFNNAAGKVIKALESRDLLEKYNVKKHFKGSSIEFDSLETELREIREKGVAVDYGGLGEGVISVAVAVKDYAGKVVGAITMLGPSFRMLADRLEQEIIPSLQECATTLSAKFGYARG
jgi:DNA-binding IclR family transcriptional regulator